MLTIADLLAVLSFAIACFASGYTVGRNSKAKSSNDYRQGRNL